MRRTAATIVLTFGLVLLVAGTALAATKMCPGNCRGTADGDRLVGSSRANTIYAEDGNDRVLGRGGEDSLKGGEGNDRVKGSAGTDEVHGGPGDDLVRGAPWSGRTTGCATSSTAAKARTRPTS